MINLDELYAFIDWFYEENEELHELACRYPHEFNSWYFESTDEKFDMEWVKNH